jgi:two-component sensor histidine kinase
LADSANRLNKINNELYFRINLNVCKAYVSLKQYQRAAYIVNKLNGIKNTFFDPLQRSQFEMQQSLIDSATGNFKNAYSHFKNYKNILDSLYNIDKTRKIDSIQFAFESMSKDRDILLKAKNIQNLTKISDLQNVKLKQSELIRNLIIFGCAVLLVLSTLLYNRYQGQIKSNQLLELQRIKISNQNVVLGTLNDKQQILITEKEWLLKEIHHRVKNNLQIVISLLNSQSSYLSDGAALDAIRESQNRMHSISLIHQKLYQSDNLAQIYMVDYIDELTDHLHSGIGAEKVVEFDLQIEPISLDVAHAVPVGLILNEAVTNAIKYAFQPGKLGKITIALDETDRHIQLLISDNGPGLPSDYDITKSNSLGMSLIHGLSRQMSGQLDFISLEGLTLKLIFPSKIPDLTDSDEVCCAPVA